MNILIIGGAGGIGSALLQALLASKPKATLFATFRHSKPTLEHRRLRWFQLDASDERSIEQLAAGLPQLDILINAIGFLHGTGRKPEKSIAEFDPEFFQHNIQANTLPTLLLAKHFSKHLRSKTPSYFVSFSARIGSIEDNRIGGWVSYRASKAALNMALKTISIEWKRKLPNCCIFGFHPGTTDTALSEPFQRNVPEGKLFTPGYVAECLLALIDKLDVTDTGKLFSYSGEEIAW